MSLEIYWKKALEKTRLSIDDESLYPLKTDIITRDLYEKDDFIIRKLDTSKFNKKKIYGPLSVQSKSYKDIKGRKVLDVLNQENKKLILSINCDTNEVDVRIPGRKWMGSKPAKEEFENNLINDFC